jgi:hypothetical protein
MKNRHVHARAREQESERARRRTAAENGDSSGGDIYVRIHF